MTKKEEKFEKKSNQTQTPPPPVKKSPFSPPKTKYVKIEDFDDTKEK